MSTAITVQHGVLRRLWYALVKTNIFKSALRQQPSDIKRQRWATRIYILCLSLGVTILAFNAFLKLEKKSIQVRKPTIETVLYLQSQREFNSSLQCSCTQINTPYGQLLHIQPVYHQVCTSDFVLYDRWLYFIRALLTVNSQLPLNRLDFRRSFQMFHLLASVCDLINKTTITSLQQLQQSELVTNYLLSVDLFVNRMDVIVKNFQLELSSTFLRVFQMTHNITYVNQYLSDANAAFDISGSRTAALSIYSYSWGNGSSSYQCSCANDINCKSQLGLYDVNYVTTPYRLVPGLFRGCFTLGSFLQSTLECFYDNDDCLLNVTGFYNQDWFPTNFTRLDSSQSSRFRKDSMMSSLLSELFIEYWNQSLYYSSYFALCQPTSCSYDLIRRNSILESITIVLGLVGGLSVTLRILISSLAAVYATFVQRRINMRSTPRARKYLGITVANIATDKC